MIVAGLTIGLTMAGLGIIIKFGKQYWLIAGYNTMPRWKQKNVDIQGLGNYLGNWFFGLATLVLAGMYLGARSSYLIINYKEPSRTADLYESMLESLEF